MSCLYVALQNNLLYPMVSWLLRLLSKNTSSTDRCQFEMKYIGGERVNGVLWNYDYQGCL